MTTSFELSWCKFAPDIKQWVRSRNIQGELPMKVFFVLMVIYGLTKVKANAYEILFISQRIVYWPNSRRWKKLIGIIVCDCFTKVGAVAEFSKGGLLRKKINGKKLNLPFPRPGNLKKDSKIYCFYQKLTKLKILIGWLFHNLSNN